MEGKAFSYLPLNVEMVVVVAKHTKPPQTCHLNINHNYELYFFMWLYY